MKLSKGILVMMSAVALLLVSALPAMAILEPPVFNVTDLIVDPAEPAVGQPLTISVKVTNVSSAGGDYTAELKVNDEPVDSQTVSLEGGNMVLGYSFADLEFTFTPPGEGTYTFAIGNQKTTLTVTADGGGASAAEEPEPVVEEPEPVVAEPEQVVAETEPVVEEPEPVVAEPEPVVEEPEPVVEEPEPVAYPDEESDFNYLILVYIFGGVVAGGVVYLFIARGR
jgi:hypothetical protein